jgi:hypothetical protein
MHDPWAVPPLTGRVGWGLSAPFAASRRSIELSELGKLPSVWSFAACRQRLLRPRLTSDGPSCASNGAPSCKAARQISRGKARDLRSTLSHLRPAVPNGIGLRVLRPSHPQSCASYALRVPQVGVTPAASSRRHLTTPPLRFSSRFSPSEPAEDFHLLVTSRFAFACRFKSNRAMPGTPHKKSHLAYSARWLVQWRRRESN